MSETYDLDYIEAKQRERFMDPCISTNVNYMDALLSAAPAMLADLRAKGKEIERLKADNAAMRAMLKLGEWSAESGTRCPACGGRKTRGHGTGCELARLVGGE